MNKLSYAPEAKNDLVDIKKYISDELMSPEAAQNVVGKITKRLRRLEQFAEIGTPLSSIFHVETDYRFLVCDNYLAFYRVEKNIINIIRVLHSKRNYITTLFGDLTSAENEE